MKFGSFSFSFFLEKSLSFIKSLFQSFSYLFFPPSCIICGEVSELSLCSECKSKIDFIENFPHCRKCSLVLPENMECPDCANFEFNFSKLFSIFSYSGYGEVILQKIKFEGKLFVLEAFSYDIQKIVSGIDFDIVVPVPSYISKFVKRGYNPSFSIAYLVSRISSKPVVFALEKIKNTPSQLDIPKEERISNPRGAFVCVKDVKGKIVLLVDDVATTCSTLSECSKVLREKGAKDVIAFALARTPLSR
jgi:competence protein ComFC